MEPATATCPGWLTAGPRHNVGLRSICLVGCRPRHPLRCLGVVAYLDAAEEFRHRDWRSATMVILIAESFTCRSRVNTAMRRDGACSGQAERPIPCGQFLRADVVSEHRLARLASEDNGRQFPWVYAAYDCAGFQIPRIYRCRSNT